ncbi:MAG: hypothetical protein AB7T38_14330 [Nitrospirales bacterium]
MDATHAARPPRNPTRLTMRFRRTERLPSVVLLLFLTCFNNSFPLAILDDRALALERSWEQGWMTCVGSDRFAQPFDDLWKAHQYTVPLLFLNSTVVETGQRIIMHPLPFAAHPHQSSPKGIIT